MEDEIRLFYDLTAEETANRWYKEEMLKPTIEEFVSLLPKDPKVLDLGCGTGHESMRLAQAGAQVLGIDFSERCITIARERCPQCRFEVQDFRYLDERFGKFEGIFACGSLIHIKHEDLTDVLGRMKDLLIKDGYMAVILVKGKGISEKMSLIEVNGKKIRRTVYLYNQEDIVKAAKKSGLAYIREVFLPEKLKQYGWRNHILQNKS
ncbi:MAG: methyltransferase domain-containing protein [Candidatus Atribacteria bacterium]|nr:methyltransferase domain-containing protein [Candidatus Atribacteria bacterium]